MKIFTLVRALNEEAMIGRCLGNHQFCDKILVADGGSTDETMAIATAFDNVTVRVFPEKIPTKNGFLNPEPKHQNFLFDWADEEGADWIIIADCDTWPNRRLQEAARNLIEVSVKNGFDGIMAWRLYLWGEDQYFPRFGQKRPGIWGYKTSLGIRYPTSVNTFFEMETPVPDPKNCFKLDSLHVLLHYFSSPEREKQRLAKYEAWGAPQVHMLKSMYAPPESLPLIYLEGADSA